MPAPKPPVPPATIHALVLVQLLYGRHPWITRTADGTATVSTGKLAEACRTRTADIQRGLERLEDQGIVQWFHWHRHYAVIKIQPPTGYALVISPEVIDV